MIKGHRGSAPIKPPLTPYRERREILVNNLNTNNPNPTSLQEPSENPEGFIPYSTYSAVRGETQTYTPLLPPNQGNASLSYAVGGSVATVSFEGSKIGNRQSSPSRHRGGGIRGKVRGFSRVSRRNLLRLLAAINREAFRAFEGKVYFLTLTYPHEWPEDPNISKRHLKAFLKRLERRYGPFAAFWRMGIQKRGAWHFHVLLFTPRSFGSIGDLRRFVASTWYEVCGKVSEGHLRAGTNVEVVRKWRTVTSRAERYLAREEEFPEVMQTGRIWGRWNADLLPVRWETVQVSLRDAYRVRRVFRKLAGMRSTGPLWRLTVFVRHENVARLLRFLGYQQLE
jgi:hypothetical protein